MPTDPIIQSAFDDHVAARYRECRDALQSRLIGGFWSVGSRRSVAEYPEQLAVMTLHNMKRIDALEREIERLKQGQGLT